MTFGPGRVRWSSETCLSFSRSTPLPAYAPPRPCPRACSALAAHAMSCVLISVSAYAAATQSPFSPHPHLRVSQPASTSTPHVRLR
eukprot:3728243-Rhodomonas_salina.1